MGLVGSVGDSLDVNLIAFGAFKRAAMMSGKPCH
jgi:hypothetical protein